MKRSKFSRLLLALSILLIIKNQAKADEINNAMMQAEENPNEEQEISNAIHQEQQFEENNGGGFMLNEEGNPVGEGDPNELNVQLDPNVPSENLAGEDEFMLNKEALKEGVSDEADAETYVITLNHLNEMERLKNFKAISQDLKVFEDDYRDCLQRIPSLVWCEDEIEKCVGPDFTQIVNDINYERAKIKDRAAIALREIVVKECYEKAGEDEIQSDSCDRFETDMIKMLWDQMEIYKMMVFNRDKYLFVYGRMAPETFDGMMEKIKPINDDLSRLIDEIEAHRDLIVLRIKSYVDDRTKAIINLANYNKRNGIESMKTYDLHITQTIDDKGISVAHLPNNMRLDANVHGAFTESPYNDMDKQIENMKAQNLQGVYEDSQKIVFDEGDKDPQDFIITQVTGEDRTVPLKRNLRHLRTNSRKRKEIKKMELQQLRRDLMKKQILHRRNRKYYNLV